MDGRRGVRLAGSVDFSELRRGLPLLQLMHVANERHGPRMLSMPGLQLTWSSAIQVTADDDCLVACIGSLRGRFEEAASTDGAAQWLSAYRANGLGCLQAFSGHYSLVLIDIRARRAICAVDRFAVLPLCYGVEGSRLAFSDRADTVPLRVPPEVDPQSLLDYLYFHAIPAPRTVFRNVQRLRGAQALVFADESLELASSWEPHFEEHRLETSATLKEEFRNLVRAAVAREAAGSATGAFLSGGTDSSTVAGMLGVVTGQAARTYSIGFDAEGYDEMEYARIAATHFGTDHREYYVTPEDLIAGIPLVAAHYDQPFGNSSALPAYYCAKIAASEGIEKLLAGDGGDELFGGNTRYAMQRVYGIYEELPAILREHLLDPIPDRWPAANRLPVVRKVANYVRQARLVMPDRMEGYNLLRRLGIEHVLAPAFQEQVDGDEPVRHQRAVYDECEARSLINRMLAYDWKFTLSDNDLPKVCGTTQLAGLQVGFPLLADEIVDFSLRLAPNLKLNGLKLRYFFKEALRGFLPDRILAKKKHGFGLPFGVWLTRHPCLREFAFDRLSSLGNREIVRREFLEELTGRRLEEHAGYYGGMIWVLMMLEEWLASRASLALPRQPPLPIRTADPPGQAPLHLA